MTLGYDVLGEFSSSINIDGARHWLGTAEALKGIAYGNGHFVVIGPRGAILESGSIITLELTPTTVPGLLSLSLTAPTGSNYTVQSSPDLTTWTTVTNLTSFQPTTVISSAVRPGPGQLFFRAYSQ